MAVRDLGVEFAGGAVLGPLSLSVFVWFVSRDRSLCKRVSFSFRVLSEWPEPPDRKRVALS